MPNVVTYNALMSSCAEGKQPNQAVELFEVMQRQDMVPNVITYNALIHSCVEGHTPRRALGLLEVMQR